MKEICCTGNHYEIGKSHGSSAKVEIRRSLEFYRDLFLKTAELSWDEACAVATKFDDLLQNDWPHYIDEMRGVADGAEVPYASILALNVRTEITYGMSKDGCTALYLKNENSACLAQNWDWQEEQKENLINFKIHRPSKPAISMVTEAGIIGKIGLNSTGVGVCLNAIRAHGVDFTKLPCHLALRTCLESGSVSQAVRTLQKTGVASACHILVGDANGAVGLECTSIDIVKLLTNDVLTHTNHLIKTHPGVEDKMALRDSPIRLERINELVQRKTAGDDSYTVRADTVHSWLADEAQFPTAICWSRTAENSVATLFSIVMDLKEKTGKVIVGRPTQENAEVLRLAPSL